MTFGWRAIRILNAWTYVFRNRNDHGLSSEIQTTAFSMLIKVASFYMLEARGSTPVMILTVACKIGDLAVELVQKALDNGADPKQTTHVGTALHAACASERPCTEIIDLLISSSGDVNAKSPAYHESQSPLHVLCRNRGASLDKRLEIAQRLIDHGANVNMRDSDSATPVDYCDAREDTEMVKLLTKAGAQPHQLYDPLHGSRIWNLDRTGPAGTLHSRKRARLHDPYNDPFPTRGSLGMVLTLDMPVSGLTAQQSRRRFYNEDGTRL
ncbi:ankyrin repeat-containing domain protein [Whalleya microplaca]|nr:ankyrin repeat-containing domain protein [Whalleya microplaca]